MVPAIACLLFTKDTVVSFMSTNECQQRGTKFNIHLRDGTHTLMNHPACETPGWQFIAVSGFKPKLDSLETSMHTSRLGHSASPYTSVIIGVLTESNLLKYILWGSSIHSHTLHCQVMNTDFSKGPLEFELSKAVLFFCQCRVHIPKVYIQTQYPHHFRYSIGVFSSSIASPPCNVNLVFWIPTDSQKSPLNKWYSCTALSAPTHGCDDDCYVVGKLVFSQSCPISIVCASSEHLHPWCLYLSDWFLLCLYQ